MDTVRPFTDPAAVARYAEDVVRKVPGYADLHRMTMLLLAERAPGRAEILVYGAGGGLELGAFAQAQPEWWLTGVDPSAEMLDLAREVVRPHKGRVVLQQGYIDDVRPGPFDGAACLLTLHFLEGPERLRALREMHRRLKPGARLVVAHHSAAPGGSPRDWLARSIGFAGSADAAGSAEVMAARLPILRARDDESLLRDAGFFDISLFYAAFSFRGWVATA